VLGEEPPRNGNPLLDLTANNVLFTPHTARVSESALATFSEQLIQNLECFVSGRPQNELTKRVPDNARLNLEVLIWRWNARLNHGRWTAPQPPSRQTDVSLCLIGLRETYRLLCVSAKPARVTTYNVSSTRFDTPNLSKIRSM